LTRHVSVLSLCSRSEQPFVASAPTYTSITLARSAASDGVRSLKSPNPLLSHQNAPGAAAACGRATKNPARHPARAAGVASVNTFFWKILVTRVKRKVDEFDRGGFQAGRGPLRGDAAIR